MKLPSWVYGLVLSLLIVIVYKFSNREKKNDSNFKYFFVFIVLFVIFFLGFSYVLEHKTYVKLTFPKMSGGGGVEKTVTNGTGVADVEVPKPVITKNVVEVDTNLPNF